MVHRYDFDTVETSAILWNAACEGISRSMTVRAPTSTPSGESAKQIFEVSSSTVQTTLAGRPWPGHYDYIDLCYIVMK